MGPAPPCPRTSCSLLQLYLAPFSPGKGLYELSQRVQASVNLSAWGPPALFPALAGAA